MSRELSKSTIHTLILAILKAGSLHGYAIAREIERQSENVLTCQEGVLYPSLRVLENDGLVVSNWDTSGSGPARKIYTLTPKGQRELEDRNKAWQKLNRAMTKVLGGEPDGKARTTEG